MEVRHLQLMNERTAITIFFVDVFSAFISVYVVHFSGYLEYSDRPFESNNRSKHPPMMKLGRGLSSSGGYSDIFPESRPEVL